VTVYNNKIKKIAASKIAAHSHLKKLKSWSEIKNYLSLQEEKLPKNLLNWVCQLVLKNNSNSKKQVYEFYCQKLKQKCAKKKNLKHLFQ
jgi:hypothetical protein